MGGLNLLVDLVTVTKSASWEILLDRNWGSGLMCFTNLVIVMKSINWEICLSGNEGMGWQI